MFIESTFICIKLPKIKKGKVGMANMTMITRSNSRHPTEWENHHLPNGNSELMDNKSCTPWRFIRPVLHGWHACMGYWAWFCHGLLNTLSTVSVNDSSPQHAINCWVNLTTLRSYEYEQLGTNSASNTGGAVRAGKSQGQVGTRFMEHFWGFDINVFYTHVKRVRDKL